MWPTSPSRSVLSEMDLTEVTQVNGELVLDTYYHLPTIAAEINEAVVAASAQLRAGTLAALRAGNLLLRAKPLVEHGGWEQWVAENTSLAPRTARAYMGLANKVSTLGAETATRVADLPLREAIKAITTSPDKPAAAPRPSDYRAAKRDDADRAVDALRKSAAALRSAAKDVNYFRTVRGDKLVALRTRLAKTLELIDQMMVVEASS